MNNLMLKILVPLMVAGVIAGSSAVVKVNSLETKVNGQDTMMRSIHKDVRELRMYFLGKRK